MRARRLIAVFEPRSWSSRLAVFQEPYTKAFNYADYVIIAGVYNTSKASELGKVLDVDELVKDIELQGKPALEFPDADSIVEHLAPELTRRRCRRDYVKRRFRRNSRENFEYIKRIKFCADS